MGEHRGIEGEIRVCRCHEEHAGGECQCERRAGGDAVSVALADQQVDGAECEDGHVEYGAEGVEEAEAEFVPSEGGPRPQRCSSACKQEEREAPGKLLATTTVEPSFPGGAGEGKGQRR